MIRRLLSVVAVLAVLGASAVQAQAPPAAELARVPRVSLAEFKALHTKKAILPIDVRDAHAFENGHVPGALNVSFVDVEIMGNRMLEERRPIVAYCACPDEGSSLRVAAHLMRIGVKDIRVLVGGWDAWKASGGKVETGMTPSL